MKNLLFYRSVMGYMEGRVDGSVTSRQTGRSGCSVVSWTSVSVVKHHLQWGR